MTSPTYTSFIEVVCDVPPRVASAAYDDVITGDLAGPRWELRLGAPLPVRGVPPALRVNSGLLVAGWPWRAAVVIELDVWSRQRVTVGVRPRGRDVPPIWTSLYFATAHAAAVQIAAGIRDWTELPLRELSRPA